MVYTKFGWIDENNKSRQWRSVRVVGIEYVFKILCLICKIMIYRLPVKDSVDRANVDKFERELKEIEGDDFR